MVPAIHIGRLVPHLCRAGEPALPGRIHESSRLKPRRSRRPKAQACVLLQTPGIFEGMIIAGVQSGSSPVQFHRHAGFADRSAQRIAHFLQVDELDADFDAIGERHLQRFPSVEIHGSEQRQRGWRCRGSRRRVVGGKEEQAAEPTDCRTTPLGMNSCAEHTKKDVGAQVGLQDHQRKNRYGSSHSSG